MTFPWSPKRERTLGPEMMLALGFFGVILLGAFLLALPASSRSGESIGFFDSLFTSTSAVCVTGLVVVDTGSTFSVLGQVVLMLLIQVGGLGFMVFATLTMVMLGRRLSIKGRILIRESMNGTSLTDLGRLTISYLLLALSIEGAGALLLAIRFIPRYGLGQGLWFSLFHAVSAFCNAGFDLFGGFSSLTAYSRDPLILLTVGGLIILGGLGFSVILETIRCRRNLQEYSLHTRIVLTVTLFLLITGTIFYRVVEADQMDLLNAFFQSVTMRTAGFNSVNLSSMKDGTKLFSSLLMVIGASPASTGGGLKTTTVATVCLLILTVVRGRRDIQVAHRRLSEDTMRRALAVAFLFTGTLVLGILALTLIEDGRFSLGDIVFECSSAMGTVGVSSIGTPGLSRAAQFLLIPMMFLGRIGPLTLATAIGNRQEGTLGMVTYPEEKIMIG